MEFTFAHNNFNVLDLDKSLRFYDEALGLREVRRIERPDFTIVYLGDGKMPHQLELTYLKDRTKPYDLGKTSSTWRFGRTILRRPTPNTRPWAVFATKIRPWESISSRIPITIGWKSCRRPKADGRTGTRKEGLPWI